MHCETISTLLRLQAQPNSDCAKLFFLAKRQGDLSAWPKCTDYEQGNNKLQQVNFATIYTLSE